MKKIGTKNEKIFALGAALVVVVFIVALGIGIVKLTKSKTTISEPTEEPISFSLSGYNYEEAFGDSIASESVIRLYIHDNGNATPTVRTYPEILEQTEIGRISSGVEIFPMKAWTISGEDKTDSWIGVRYADIKNQIKTTTETVKIDNSGIVWINCAFAEIYLRDRDPGEFDDENYGKTELYRGEYKINATNCKVYSCPWSFDPAIYGIISSEIKTDVVYIDESGDFYGVPATSIPLGELKNRVGNPTNDPDSIVWIPTGKTEGIDPV